MGWSGFSFRSCGALVAVVFRFVDVFELILHFLDVFSRFWIDFLRFWERFGVDLKSFWEDFFMISGDFVETGETLWRATKHCVGA